MNVQSHYESELWRIRDRKGVGKKVEKGAEK